MSDSIKSINQYNQAAGSITNTKADINDYIYRQWATTNWGDLVQPAPSAVAVLGQLTIVAALRDFNIIPPKDGFKYVQYSSFRAAIMQLVNQGATSLELSYKNFKEIELRANGLSPGISNIIRVLAGSDGNTPEQDNADIKRFVPNLLQQLRSSTQQCVALSKQTDDTFRDLLGLAMELNESCTATQGDNESKIADAKLKTSILDEQKKAAEENKQLAAKREKESREAFQDARQQFQKAADSFPSGWDLVGMQIVQGLGNALLGGLNAGINKAVGSSQQSTQTQNSAINQAGGVPSTNTNANPVIPSDVSDFGYTQAGIIGQAATSLEHMVTSGKGDDGVNWDLVGGPDGKSGAAYLRVLMQSSLDSRGWSQAEPSVTAKGLLTSGVQIAQRLQDALPLKQPEAVKAIVNDTRSWAFQTTSFTAKANLVTNNPSLKSNGFLQSPQPQASDGSIADMAVKNAQFKLESAQSELKVARESYDKATDKMLEVTTALGEILGQIKSLDLEKIKWDEIRQVLIRAIAFLCQLKGQLNDLVHYFDMVDSVIKVTLGESVTNLIQLIDDATGASDPSIAGISLSTFVRQTIFDSTVCAAKVSRLVQRIAQVYTDVYDKNVHSGVSQLLAMGALVTGSDQAGLQAAGAKLQTWANGASKGISDYIKQQQATFQRDIDQRGQEIAKTIGNILPKPSNNVSKAIESAAANQAKAIDSALTDAQNNKPTYKPNLGDLDI